MARPYFMWVEGRAQAGSEELIAVEDPATGNHFATCHAASSNDVNAAVSSAHLAFGSGVWSRAARNHRADVLDQCAAFIVEALPRLISLEVRQTGRPVAEMNAQVPSLAKWFKYYAALLRVEERPVLPTAGKLHNFINRVPLGVVALITPFNHPLLIAVKKIAPALAAGNSVIVKPSELTPLTTLLLGDILQRAGIPDGVFTVLTGYGHTTGKYLVEHPLIRKVDVTGGTAAGRAIGKIVGGNLARFTAELGGKAPLIVFEDANVDVAVNGIAFGSYIASGQTCIASTRIIVDNKIIDSVLKNLMDKVDSITRRMGAPTNPESTMGPLISAKQLQKVKRLVDQAVSDEEAVILRGGRRMQGLSPLDGFDFTDGYFYEPTVLVSSPRVTNSITKTSIWREEAFGPVIVVAGFEIEDEAIILANDSEFGLGASIWTADLARAFRISEEIEAGIVWVNTHHRNDPSSPWGGAKAASGVGSENGVEAYQAYTTTRSTVVNYASAAESLATDDWFGERPGNARYG